ncbi:hypothetical protein [Streptomyces sp. WM6378]|uniref:hypothetical protein n=1 Tax=Streptomyces sp. WM6378 TaxID=1415557 RepID=UPI0006B05A93|nr:hypothetical protein [Streptomyces sp. WM6378]KOU43196.1 hypothetical protein ADK54_17880 [Streptomyces sp. WM6378]
MATFSKSECVRSVVRSIEASIESFKAERKEASGLDAQDLDQIVESLELMRADCLQFAEHWTDEEQRLRVASDVEQLLGHPRGVLANSPERFWASMRQMPEPAR